MKIKCISLLLVNLIWVFLPGARAQENVNQNPVRIGILTDLSGVMAAWGTQTRVGAELARDEIIRAGGKIELIFSDHKLQAKNAVSEFQKLTDFDQVDAVYVEFTPAAVAVAPISKTKKVPIVYSAAAVSPLAASPYAFKTYMDYVQGCRELARKWQAQKLLQVGILKINLEFGDLCVQGIKSVYPSALETAFNPSEDVSTQVLWLKSKGIEAIASVGFEPDFLRLLRSLRDLNWNPAIGAQDDVLGGTITTDYSQGLKQATFFALPILPADFTSRVKAANPEKSLVSVSAAGLGYLHVKQLYSARRECPRQAIECLMQKLAASPADGTTGFQGWHERVARFEISLRTP